MFKPRKPVLPVRSMVEDYRCCEPNQDCMDDNGPCEICEEREECCRHLNLYRITVGELIDTYGENARDIEIETSYSNPPSSLIINRPENDEEFTVRLKEYEKEVIAYNQWMESNTPEKKKEKAEAKRLERLEKLKRKLEELSGKV